MPLRGERWLLPEGVEELLPRQAARVELLRRRLLDLFSSWGYEQVIPPLIEYLESLLTGVGHDLELQTFKLTDQLSGRLLGVRPATLYRWRRAGSGPPYIKFGGKRGIIRYRQSDIREWLDSRVWRPTSDDG